MKNRNKTKQSNLKQNIIFRTPLRIRKNGSNGGVLHKLSSDNSKNNITEYNNNNIIIENMKKEIDFLKKEKEFKNNFIEKMKQQIQEDKKKQEILKENKKLKKELNVLKANDPLLENQEIQDDEDLHEKEEKKGKELEDKKVKKGEEIKYEEQKDEEDEDLQGNEMIEINEKARRTIYICLVLVSLFSSCDGGIIPQQNSKIQTDFVGDENDNSLVGFFGSVDYIGRVIGALIFAVIMGKMNRKKLLIATLILKSITLFIALPFKNSTINIIFRGISGISQVFYTSYLPVWCDQYGKKKHRALMVTIVQLGNPIGIILGYGMGMLCDTFAPEGYSGWRISFAIEGAILIVCALIILGFKKKYFSENFVLLKDNFGKEEVKEEEENSKIINTKNIEKKSDEEDKPKKRKSTKKEYSRKRKEDLSHSSEQEEEEIYEKEPKRIKYIKPKRHYSERRDIPYEYIIKKRKSSPQRIKIIKRIRIGKGKGKKFGKL